MLKSKNKYFNLRLDIGMHFILFLNVIEYEGRS